MLAVLAWLLMPFLAGRPGAGVCLKIWPVIPASVGLALGGLLLAAGYAGTLWCYALMGDTWRMGVDRGEKTVLVTRGLYGVIRHPIYGLQTVMLGGVFVLLPTAVSLLALLLHLLCVWFKTRDEEAHLLRVHGEAYQAYRSRTGGLFPRIFRTKSPPDVGGRAKP
jgi:protein-S-isoprenylcysteine O-methyltransferase Ste14